MSMMRQPSHAGSMSSSTASPKPGRYSIFRKKTSISSSSVPREEHFPADKVYEVCGPLSQHCSLADSFEALSLRQDAESKLPPLHARPRSFKIQWPTISGQFH